MIHAVTRAMLLGTSLAICGCGNFRTPAEGPSGAPRYVELLKEKQVATLHFPAGLYSFRGIDNSGIYYQSPRPIVQRTAYSSIPRKGGIFVNKENPDKLRGYIYYAGKLTQIGDFSKTPHQFRK